MAPPSVHVNVRDRQRCINLRVETDSRTLALAAHEHPDECEIFGSPPRGVAEARRTLCSLTVAALAAAGHHNVWIDWPDIADSVRDEAGVPRVHEDPHQYLLEAGRDPDNQLAFQL